MVGKFTLCVQSRFNGRVSMYIYVKNNGIINSASRAYRICNGNYNVNVARYSLDDILYTIFCLMRRRERGREKKR